LPLLAIRKDNAMKIEKLTDNKIRVILDIDDLAHKNINIDSLIQNSDFSQKLFKKMLNQAKKEVGFETEDSQVLIEAYISSEGYFIITFTKIANDLAKNISHSSSPKPKAKRKNLNTSCKTAIYQFDKFDDYTNFCTYLDNLNFQNVKGFAKKISLYEFEKKYFLVFNEINIGHKNISFLYTSISEFGKLVSNSKNFESKLIEYGKTIFKNNALQNGIIFFLNS